MDAMHILEGVVHYLTLLLQRSLSKEEEAISLAAARPTLGT